MSESLKAYEKEPSHKSTENYYQGEGTEGNGSNDDDGSSRFIIKRTETSDIFYFSDPPTRNPEEARLTIEYNEFFNLEDIEMGYENSTFSITVIDQNENKYVVVVF